jgi:hypothetical protein
MGRLARGGTRVLAPHEGRRRPAGHFGEPLGLLLTLLLKRLLLLLRLHLLRLRLSLLFPGRAQSRAAQRWAVLTRVRTGGRLSGGVVVR